MDFPLVNFFNVLLEVSGVKEKVARSEQVIRLKQRFGIADIESLNKFEDVYAYALVEYAFDEEGLGKPRELVEFFKLKAVRDVFRVAYRDSNPAGWLGKGQAIAQYELGDKLPASIDPKRELGVFAAVFLEVVRGSRSPKENLQAQELEKLRGEMGRSLQAIQTQLQQLPTLEAINQQVNQLSGASSASQTLALPAAAQNSNAVDLAHRLGEWFEVLDYDRDPDYEEWTTDYFEWMINFPLGRRKVSRTLVRGVAGVVEMADLQDFARAVERAGADEGWLVGNRRVSQATRKVVQADAAYEDISCYTFDELLDEDADFSKYLNWLEAEIKAKKVDTEYLALACRKDELDPTSQRKIGVSVYGEDDGWIDGYVDMWLDDPAKEHLSVLGEFGTGKTWFVLHYAWEALQRYREAKRRGTERPRIPVVVPLRDYAKAVSVESLFSEFFFRKHEILKNYSVFEQLNRMGKLLLIFDGFDEMAARVNRQAMIDNFWELAKVVVPGAKAILTCRTEHFPDAMEGRQLLGAELESSTAILTGETPQFEVLELEKFEDKQIAQLLKRKAQASTVEEVMGNEQLLDLARRPVMVDLILEALPDIEAGNPVDMARVYLYAVRNKIEKDITSERSFTSQADKLYFLCELSWEMLSTNQMSLNYRAFPERLRLLFPQLKGEQEIDYWRYDMMGQTMLIRNSEGDYSPAHRSLLEFFVAYKIVASLGAMANDFTAIARAQSHIDNSLLTRDYTWKSFFKREYNESGVPMPMAQLRQFKNLEFDELLPLLGRERIAKAVLDLAHPMLEEKNIRQQLLPLLQGTASRTFQESGYIGGNITQLMIAKTPYALINADLVNTKMREVNFVQTYLRRVSLEKAQLSDVNFSKVLGGVNAVAYSPDGNNLAIGDTKGILQIWDIATEKVVLFCVGHGSSICSVTYSPNGQQLASASHDKTIKLWNVVTGECVCTLEGHRKWVWSVAYSPDGQRLASASHDKTIKLWNVVTGECVCTLEGHHKLVRAVAYSPNGKQVASASDDCTVKLWNAITGECVCTLEGHHNLVRAVTYNPNGKQVASASDDCTVKLWNAATGEYIHTLEGHRSTIRSLVYSPDGQQLASASDDKTIKLWDIVLNDCIRTLEGYENRIWVVAYSPDGQQLASACDDKTVKMWNALSGKCIRILKGHEGWFLSVAYSPDGQQLASACDDKTVKLWSSATGECICTLQGHKDWVRSAVYRSDGQQIASAGADSTIKLWNAMTGECICTLKGHRNSVLSVVYSPNGQQLASASYDSTIRLWNAMTGECIRTLEDHERVVLSVVYSPNGQHIASASDDRTIRLWNSSTGECIRTLEGHEKAVLSVAYSPDGQQLVSAGNDRTIKLWNSATGKCIYTFEGHEDVVRSVACSVCGRQVASASADRTIRLWDLASGTCIRILQGHEARIRSVIYSPDGNQLASASDDNTIRFWEVATGKCLRIIDERVCTGLNITDTIGLTPGQRTALKLMGAVDHNDK
ncbi:MAG: NACHT domain-containing protein [Phormidesmis sp.]